MRKLGKLFSYFIIAIGSILFINNVQADSASISVKSSANTVVVGKTIKVTVTISSSEALGAWEYSLNYDSSMANLTASDVAAHYAASASNSSTKSVSYNYTFKMLKEGSAKFYISSSSALGWDEQDLSVSNGSKTVTVISQAKLEASYSKDNYLKSLVVEGYEESFTFDKETLEYNLEVDSTVSSVNIAAKKNDSKASINGSGEVSLNEGLNKFEVVVTAQNGSKRTYVLNITQKELNPIIVKIDNEEYTVVKNKEQLTLPTTFIEKTIIINEEEVPAFYNETLDYTLVGLKDSLGNIKLYVYDETQNNYKLYIEYKFNQLIINILNSDEKKDYYTLTKIKINDQEVNALKLNTKSRFALIYGINVQNGEKGFFVYDEEDGTLQKYNDEEVIMLQQEIKDYYFILLVFGAGMGLLFVIIVLLSVNKKKSKKKKQPIKLEELAIEDNKIKKEKETKKEKKLNDKLSEWDK